jgi:acyl-CoA synthetase (AMP-forming)/AMP-acid ligase II/1-acyl-sn-glycerol-3-phosphate acyltransferase/acyl carrier protein
MYLVRLLFCATVRLLMSLRYRVRLNGYDELKKLTGPTLILPSHPAYVDPMILFTNVWPRFQPRPLVAEDTFKIWALWPIMKLVRAICVPDVTRVDAEARANANKAVETVIECLRRGENQLFWPSGRLERRGYEILGGARALTEVLKAVPEANVIMVRTRGLWGSSFSFAWTGKLPNLADVFLGSLGWLLASALFFMPRRNVDITFRLLDRKELPPLEREKINPWFEAWYNQPGHEQPTFVPYHPFLGRREFEYPALAEVKEVDLDSVTAETKTAVAQLLAEKLNRPLKDSELQPDVTLDSLGLDSLGRMELTLDVERQFGHSSDDVPENVGQIWGLAQGLAAESAPQPAPKEWFAPLGTDLSAEILDETIAAAFVARALRSRRDVAVADDRAGVLTYERMLTGVLIQAKRFAELPEKNVGLLLPTSAGGSMALVALIAAGKVPIVLNWTTGPSNLAHAVKLMGVKHVVTAKAFVNRMGIELPGVEFVHLEELFKHVTKTEKLLTLLKIRWLPGLVRGRVAKVGPDDPAAVLFTSGSEKAPKAVPLTHRNLISNERAGASAFQLTRRDSILSFMPLFHSFGLSVSGLLPLLAGIKTVVHPDPREAGKLVRKIAAYKPTLLLSTPTFLSYLLERGTNEDLASLKSILVGAEKCSAAIYARCKEKIPGAILMEGYGITECSPAVTLNTPANNRPGTVGKAVDSVELAIVDLDAGEEVPRGKQGMLLVSGVSVFAGYVGDGIESPFREYKGKRWYVTGDLVEMDADGFVTFKGRLKRFVKAGGEMVSLPALEEPFAQAYPVGDEGPRVAVEGVELGSKARVVLFTTEPITLLEANHRLKEAGFHGVMRLDEVRKIEKIPTLGSGKVDYKVLRAQIAKETPEPVAT